jgi:hypothetical protein
LFLGVHPVAFLQNTISFLHSRVIFGERFDIRARLAMDLAIFQRWVAAKPVRVNVFVNDVASAQFDGARFAVRNSVSAASLERKLAYR